jgi:hypothetical protein
MKRTKIMLFGRKLVSLLLGICPKSAYLFYHPAAAVPQRPLIAIYNYVRRVYHPLKYQGKWMPAEDESLRQ